MTITIFYSGKTAFVTFMSAELNRYQGRQLLFDRNRGMEIFVRAMGGEYLVLSPDQQENVSLNPLQLPDTPLNRQFCTEWLSMLCLKSGEMALEAALVNELGACIDYCFGQLAKEHRQLSHVVTVLPIDFPCWPELKRWLRETETQEGGARAYLFDNPKDTLSLSDFMGIDLIMLSLRYFYGCIKGIMTFVMGEFTVLFYILFTSTHSISPESNRKFHTCLCSMLDVLFLNRECF